MVLKQMEIELGMPALFGRQHAAHVADNSLIDIEGGTRDQNIPLFRAEAPQANAEMDIPRAAVAMPPVRYVEPEEPPPRVSEAIRHNALTDQEQQVAVVNGALPESLSKQLAELGELQARMADANQRLKAILKSQETNLK